MKTLSTTKQKRVETILQLFGGPITPADAIEKFTFFRQALQNGALSVNNMPLTVCFTAKEIRDFIELARTLDFDQDGLPEGRRGLALTFGLTHHYTNPNARGTIMLISTEFVKNASGITVDRINNQVFGSLVTPNSTINPGSSTRTATQAYDIGHTYP